MLVVHNSFHILYTKGEMMQKMLIKASKCPECQKVVVSPRETCPYCGKRAGTSQIIELGNKGHILSFTVAHMPPEGFEKPLVMALVELEQGAVILCLGHKEDESALAIGALAEITSDSEERFRFRLLP
jgi:uncharacterized OB-fold protein